MNYTFNGGLHIHDCKELTNTKSVVKLDGCIEHMFPLKQHIGAVLEPIVNVGDHVNVGQKIADADSFMCVPVHSSVSGTVKAIKPHLHSSGIEINTIFIENDFLYTIDKSIKPVENIDSLSKDEMLSIVREKGLVGMGGAGFPTFIKLNPGKKVDYVIVNGAECEPYITSDHRRMLENPETIIDGLRIAMKILSLNQGYIGIEANKQDAVKSINKAIGTSNDIKTCVLKTKYPQGAEKQLIKAVTKRSVPSGKLPADAGVVVLNVETVYNLSKAFREGMPPTKKIVTVTGDEVKNPGNFEVYFGVPFSYLFECADGFKTTPEKIICGGPMMGVAQFNLTAPVIKTTSALIALSHAPKIFDNTSPCIRCGKCVDHCPMFLMPLNLARFSASENYTMAEKYNICDCIDCGLCSYVCPANRNPVDFIRKGKQKVIALKKQGGK